MFNILDLSCIKWDSCLEYTLRIRDNCYFVISNYVDRKETYYLAIRETIRIEGDYKDYQTSEVRVLRDIESLEQVAMIYKALTGLDLPIK